MGFNQLIQKVHQAEHALEARERSMGADWRQLKRSWRALWTPGRIVIAGLSSGFLIGHGNIISKIGGGGTLQLFTALSGLVAGSGAQAAAREADGLRHEQDTVPPPASTYAAEHHATTNGSDNESLQRYERMRRAGLV